jgi:hypothetical protein
MEGQASIWVAMCYMTVYSHRSDLEKCLPSFSPLMGLLSSFVELAVTVIDETDWI